METELKLTASAAHLHKISSQRLLQDFATTAPVTRQLTSHYFDTPDNALHKHGLSLRVRDDAQRRTQTLKGQHDGVAAGGPVQRDEWESPVAADTPDVRGLLKANHLPPKYARVLRRVARTGTLAELFTVQAKRTTWMLDVGGASIEMALDEGLTLANGANSAFAEIELERKSGKKAALYTAASQLARHIPVQLSFVSKAERGFALLGEGMHPKKASAIMFPRGARVEQGLRHILAGCLEHAQANAQGFLDSDEPEYLHQLRVGLRRFKSALKLFRGMVALPADLQAQLDEVSTMLGAARDADVLLLTTLPRIADAGKHRDLLQGLFDHVQADAQDKRAAARLSHYAQMMLGLFAWVDGKRWRKDASRAGRARLRRPLSAWARRAVVAAHDVVAKRARKVQRLGGRDSASLHRLRIGCKQARYAVAFFSAIEKKKKAARYVKKLSAVQDALGVLNDVHVAQTILAGYMQARPELATQVRIVTAYLNGIAAARLDNCEAPWRKMAHPAAAVVLQRLVRKGGR
jgi:triphosphatase